MITSWSKCRPANNSSMLLSLLIAGPQLSERPMYPTELRYLHQSRIGRMTRPPNLMLASVAGRRLGSPSFHAGSASATHQSSIGVNLHANLAEDFFQIARGSLKGICV